MKEKPLFSRSYYKQLLIVLIGLLASLFFAMKVYLKMTQKSSPTAQSIRQIDTAVKETGPMGYIKRIYTKSGKNYVDVDYALWLTENNNGCTNEPTTNSSLPHCSPNGYLIANTDHTIDTLEIADNVTVEMQSYGSGKCYINFGEIISYSTFKKLMTDSASPCNFNSEYSPPFIFESRNGQVFKITEQYIP